MTLSTAAELCRHGTHTRPWQRIAVTITVVAHTDTETHLIRLVPSILATRPWLPPHPAYSSRQPSQSYQQPQYVDTLRQNDSFVTETLTLLCGCHCVGLSFTAGVALLNGVDEKYLSPILQRVLKSLKDRSNSALFSEAEEEQLCSVLALPAPSLHTLLSLLQYVYETALYHSLSAPRLAAVLPDSIAASYSAMLVAAYGGVRDEMLSALLADVGDGPAVGDIGWRMHVRLADTATPAEQTSRATTGKEVKTIWRIGIKDRQLGGSATADGSLAGDGDSVVFELGKAELEALYDNLETIQRQLDALTEKQT